MLKYFYSLITGVLLLTSSFNIKAQEGVDAYFYYAPFFAPGIGTYIETYLAFDPNSVHTIMGQDSMHHAMMEVTMLFKNADEIKEFRKYKLASPYVHDTIVSDSTDTLPAFIDLQRIIIPNGVYNFDLIIHDKYGPDSLKDFKQAQILSINVPEDVIAFSGIEFLESYNTAESDNIFVKHGFECIPYVADFFPVEMETLHLYAEIYSIAKELGPLEDFLIMFHIENSNTSKPIKNFSSFQKQQAKNVNVVFKSIDIKKLPTGNYYLVIEIRNRQNELVASTKRFFQRSNPDVVLRNEEFGEVAVEQTFASSFTNADSLAFFLTSLKPISDAIESQFIENQLDSVNLLYMQRFFYSFWQKRNEVAPQVAWNEYKFKLDEVQEKFGDARVPGFETDRGRVYLQYGSPSSIIVEKNEQSAYPYEIWHYYKIADLSDKKFIFYNPNLDGNSFELLHSNMVGELNNPIWERELYSRNANSSHTGKAKTYFESN